MRLWYEVFDRELAEQPSEKLSAIFDTGHQVGELACKRYAGGHLVGHDHRHFDEALADTKRLLANNEAPTLFEAAFIHKGVRVRVDILERLATGGWRVVEVKSSTRVKDTFVLDAALQFWVLRGSGLEVNEVAVLTLNGEYVYEGGEHDLNALFQLHPVTESATELQESIGVQVQAMQTMLNGQEAPDIGHGSHCSIPYRCPYYAHCTRDVEFPEYGLDDLPRLGSAKRGQLEDAGIDEIRAIPIDFPLGHMQQIVHKAVIQKREVIHGDINSELSHLQYPIRHLDFETIAPAIPRFVGTRPYSQIPFLFSVHIERNGRPPRHIDYLHEDDDDPRAELADRLIDALGKTGSICVYSSYERQVLRRLCNWLPERAAELSDIQSRLFDLLPLVRNNYYHPDFHGSFSLKNVYPVMAPGVGYEDLAIADGLNASVLYEIALGYDDQAERARVFSDLRKYCERDTLATVKILRRLENLAEK